MQGPYADSEYLSARDSLVPDIALAVPSWDVKGLSVRASRDGEHL